MKPKTARTLTGVLWLVGLLLMLASGMNELLRTVGIAVAFSCVIPFALFNRCPHCRKNLGRNAGEFCQHCGKKIEE